MKHTRLPTINIQPYRRPTKFITWAKSVIILISICILSIAVFYLNVQQEQNILLNQKIDQETNKATNGEPSVLIDATKNIIKREGKVDDKTANQYAIWIFDSAAKYAVDPMLILSVIFTESKFDYKAISPTGPIGLMQIASAYHRDKATAAELFDPKKNIQVGTQILKEYSELSNSVVETLLRYSGSLGQAPVYATKVMRAKFKFEAEVMSAMIKS